MFRRKHLIRIVLVIAVLFAVSAIIPTSYVMVSPGMMEDLKDMVRVEGESATDEGGFFLVTVKQQQANLLWFIYGIFNPYIDLRPQEQVIPPDIDEEEYREMQQKFMEESQLLAKIIALREAGYEVEIEGSGIQVHEILDDSPSIGLLQKGDVIKKVDGKEVNLADEVVSRVQDREIGDPVKLKVKRNQEKKDVEVTTTRHEEDPSQPALGVLISALDWDVTLPREIDIDAGGISGPSAGMMFVLEIINQLDEDEDITGGKSIAGTGTININKEVGSIGGVKQKVKAAEEAEAEYFLVPGSNYNQARDAAQEIEIIPVDTFKEVQEFLQGLT